MTWMAKFNRLTPLPFKGLRVRQWPSLSLTQSREFVAKIRRWRKSELPVAQKHNNASAGLDIRL